MKGGTVIALRVRRLLHLRLIDRNELRYLRGIAKSMSKMQRRVANAQNYADGRIRKIEQLRWQVRCDQAYINALEERLAADVIQQIRVQMRPLRGQAVSYDPEQLSEMKSYVNMVVPAESEGSLPGPVEIPSVEG